MASTVRIPLDLRMPGSVNAGNSFWTDVVLTAATPDLDMGHWEFVKDVVGDVFGLVTIPNTIGATPAAKIILSIAANATTGATSLFVQGLCVADGQTYDAALDTAITTQDITVPATAYFRKEVSFTLATSGGSFPVVAKDEMLIRIVHSGTDANDTLAVNTLLIAAYLEIDLA